MQDLVIMQAPVGVTNLSIGGVEYLINNDNLFHIAKEHVMAAITHGMRVVDDRSIAHGTVSLMSARAVEADVLPDAVSNVKAQEAVKAHKEIEIAQDNTNAEILQAQLDKEEKPLKVELVAPEQQEAPVALTMGESVAEAQAEIEKIEAQEKADKKGFKGNRRR